MAGAFIVYSDICSSSFNSRVYLKEMDNTTQRPGMVQSEVPPYIDAGIYYGTLIYAGTAVFIQGRNNPLQSSDHPLDCDSAVYPDYPDLRAGLRPEQIT
jgi:hypothetical protein